jgi:predicted transposase YbfD/YdcC
VLSQVTELGSKTEGWIVFHPFKEKIVMKQRDVHHICGWLRHRLPELGLGTIADPRRRSGRRWKLESLLRTTLTGILAGAQSLWELEWLTDDISRGARKVLGVTRRVPDTTLRDLLCRIHPDGLRACLHRAIKAALRRKAIHLEGMPFHMVALDGKTTALPNWDNKYAKRTTNDYTLQNFGLLRTVTCALVTARGRPCIDAIPIANETNEIGFFKTAFDELVRVYGKLFQVVSYDAGGASNSNAEHVVSAGKDYIMRLNDERRIMQQFAVELLSSKKPVAESQDVRDNTTEYLRRLYIAPVLEHSSKQSLVWRHARSLIKVETFRKELTSTVEHIETRYYVSSMTPRAMTGNQWLFAIRAHWGVENNNHCTFDKTFAEDKKPWIKESPQGALAVLILRRIAYTLMTLYRAVTLRSEERKTMRWKDMMRRLQRALIIPTLENRAEPALS